MLFDIEIDCGMLTEDETATQQYRHDTIEFMKSCLGPVSLECPPNCVMMGNHNSDCFAEIGD